MVATEQTVFPISEISSYHRVWTIRARVTNKGMLRTFAKNNNNGKVFSADLLDAEGGEIRASFFNQGADEFFDKLAVGKCYTFSKGSVRIANRQFNQCKHRYELVFDKGAQVEEVADDAKIDSIKFSVVDLKTLQSRPLPCTVDLCGMLVSCRPSFSFTSRDGKELVKREITIADDTATSVIVTLWGDRAKQEDSVFEGTPVLCLKGVVVKEWNSGRSGSLSGGGTMLFKPTLPEAERVQRWWSEGGSKQNLTSLSQEGGSGGGQRAMSGKAANLSDMRRATEQMVGQQPEMFSIVCRLAMVQMRKQGEVQPLQYLACQEQKEGSGYLCQRRVDESGFCPACNRAGKVAPRFNIRARFADFGDSAWLTTFHEGAQQVLGMKAEDARAMEQGEGGRDALEAAIQKKYFNEPIQVTVRAKPDSYNGEPRTNITCVDARPVNRGEHGRLLLKEIKSLLEAEPVRAGGA